MNAKIEILPSVVFHFISFPLSRSYSAISTIPPRFFGYLCFCRSYRCFSYCRGPVVPVHLGPNPGVTREKQILSAALAGYATRPKGSNCVAARPSEPIVIMDKGTGGHPVSRPCVVVRFGSTPHPVSPWVIAARLLACQAVSEGSTGKVSWYKYSKMVVIRVIPGLHGK